MVEYLNANLTMGKIRDDLLEELGKKYGKSTRQIERYIAEISTQSKKTKYEETPHKQKMRKLAKELLKIRLPSVMDSFTVWGVKPASYDLLSNDTVFFVIEVNKRLIAAFADLDGLEDTVGEDAEANYAWKVLFAHLNTGGFKNVVDLIKPFRQKMYAYLNGCYEFVERVNRTIEEQTGISMPSSYTEKYGFRPYFAMTVCVDAVLTDNMNSFIGDTSYETESTGGCWALKYKGQVIFVGDTKGTLSNYEKMHKNMRLKWVDTEKTEKVKTLIETRKGLESTISEVRKGLLIFAGKEILPGRCELC
jgi:hypothetical protein